MTRNGTLVIYPREIKTCVHTKTSAGMFIAPSLITVPNWKLLRYPSMGEWLKKQQYVVTIDYISVIKRNELLINATTWMNFKGIVLS